MAFPPMNKIWPILLRLVSALPLCAATTVIEEIGGGSPGLDAAL